MKSMAFRGASRRFFAVRTSHISPYLSPPSLPSPLSTQATRSTTPAGERERFVLSELSDLLPLPRSAEPKRREEESATIRPADEFLPPEEKLRGVFLQKLRGKTAIEQALSDVGVDLNVDVVAKVVNRGNLDGEKMVRFFNWAIKDPAIPKHIDTYHIVLRALSRRKFLTSMAEILQNLRSQGLIPNLETVSILADGLIKARRVSKAVQLYRNLGEIGLNCDTTESLAVFLQCLCRRSHVAAANSLLNSAKKKAQLGLAAYNAVMRGWSKLGNVCEMERLLEAMVADGVDPDGSTFVSLIEGLGRGGRAGDSVKVFESLVTERNWAPNTSAYNAMVLNFVSVGDFEEGLKWYNRMLSNNCDPNIETYARLIGAFLKARRVADALEMFDEMLERKLIPSAGTVTLFIERLCSYGPPYAAMMVYKRARRGGCRVSLSAYKILLVRLARFGKCGTLLRVWGEMEECGYSSDVEVYECVIVGLCNAGQVENGVLVMEECLRKGFCPSRVVCGKVNRKLLGSGGVERAYRLFLKVKDARKDENARRYWRSKGWHF